MKSIPIEKIETQNSKETKTVLLLRSPPHTKKKTQKDVEKEENHGHRVS